jgi:hypothetical protein
MAISLDVAASSAVSTSGTLAWNHTVGSGENRLLVVGIAAYGLSYQPSVSAVTFNGVSMTRARYDQAEQSSYYLETSVWILKNPDSGTHSISATVGGTNAESGGVSVSYAGCAQTNSPDAVNGANGTTTGGDQSFNVTTSADNCWIFAVGALRKASSATIAALQTSRGNVDIHTTAVKMRAEDTNAAQTPAGAKSVGFTLSTSNTKWCMSGASFAPYVSGGQSVVPIIMNSYRHKN